MISQLKLLLQYGIRMSFVVTKNHFPNLPIEWEDCVQKTAREFEWNTTRVLYDSKTLPTIVLQEEGYRPASIGTTFNVIKNQLSTTEHDSISNTWLWNLRYMHIYYSIGFKAVTFGRHQDKEDVMIVQAYGTMKYLMDEGTPDEILPQEEVLMEPGDSLWIEKGTWHDPIVSEPRITLSLS